jgi:hypothetical protein
MRQINRVTFMPGTLLCGSESGAVAKEANAGLALLYLFRANFNTGGASFSNCAN